VTCRRQRHGRALTACWALGTVRVRFGLNIDRAAQGDGEAEMVERRTHERRWRSASFYVVERRNGHLWRYGSIVLCLVLLSVWGRLLLS
jgi:hypothetical protein